MNYDESGATLTCDFDFNAIDEHVFGVKNQFEDSIEVTMECQRRVWAWIYQPPCEDLDGFNCRCIVAIWIFVPQLRAYSMTEIAGRFGKKKQSIGRWFASFKKVFPEITNHLQHSR